MKDYVYTLFLGEINPTNIFAKKFALMSVLAGSVFIWFEIVISYACFLRK